MALTLVAATFHAIAISRFLLTPDGFNFSFFVVAAFIALVLVILIWSVSLYSPLENLFVLVLPISALTLLACLLRPPDTSAQYALNSGLLVHILLSLLAYAVLSVSCCQAVLLLIRERQLRDHRTLQFIQTMPPLTTMETLLFQWLWGGTILLSVSIITGFIFLENMFAQRAVHHTVLSLLSWLVFAGLLLGRNIRGWRGRTAAHWTIAGFALLLLAYFGSKLVIEIILEDAATGA